MEVFLRYAGALYRSNPFALRAVSVMILGANRPHAQGGILLIWLVTAPRYSLHYVLWLPSCSRFLPRKGRRKCWNQRILRRVGAKRKMPIFRLILWPRPMIRLSKPGLSRIRPYMISSFRAKRVVRRSSISRGK